MTNYDSDSGLARQAVEEVRRVVYDAAVEYEIDQENEPQTDLVKNATTGHLADVVDSETLASWNLRRIRQMIGMSQQQLSNKLASLPCASRLSQSQIAKIERGERSWRVNEMFDLCQALGVDHIELFSGQRLDNDQELQMLATRLSTQRAEQEVHEAQEVLVAKVRKLLAAQRKQIDTAAYFGVRDESVIRLLQHQALRREDAEKILAERPSPEMASLAKERRHAACAWAEQEWQRLVEQAAKAAQDDPQDRP